MNQVRGSQKRVKRADGRGLAAKNSVTRKKEAWETRIEVQESRVPQSGCLNHLAQGWLTELANASKGIGCRLTRDM